MLNIFVKAIAQKLFPTADLFLFVSLGCFTSAYGDAILLPSMVHYCAICLLNNTFIITQYIVTYLLALPTKITLAF